MQLHRNIISTLIRILHYLVYKLDIIVRLWCRDLDIAALFQRARGSLADQWGALRERSLRGSPHGKKIRKEEQDTKQVKTSIEIGRQGALAGFIGNGCNSKK